MPKGQRGGNNAHASLIELTPKGVEKKVKNAIPKGKLATSPMSFPDTELRVLQVADMICEGKSKESCLKFIMTAKDVSLQQAKYYYQAAVNYLVPDNIDKYRQQMIAKNFKRLETLVERGMKDDADLRLAKEAIAELNKMCGIGGNKLTMARNEKGEELIQITFD